MAENVNCSPSHKVRDRLLRLSCMQLWTTQEVLGLHYIFAASGKIQPGEHNLEFGIKIFKVFQVLSFLDNKCTS